MPTFHLLVAPLSLLLLLCSSLCALGADPLATFCISPTPTNGAARKVVRPDPVASSLSPSFSDYSALIRTLVSEVRDNGFGTASVGSFKNKLYGLAMCRGPVKGNPCSDSVTESATELYRACPCDTFKEGVIWYDNCELKFSYDMFIGKIDIQNKFNLTTGVAYNGDQNTYDPKVKEFLSSLSLQASNNNKMYATGESEVANSGWFSGMAQCTRDLTRPLCKSCIDDLIKQLPNCCGGKIKAGVFSGSCQFRYEFHYYDPPKSLH